MTKVVYMPNYRLHAFAKRAGIDVASVRMPIPSLLSTEQTKFSREITDGIPLEKSLPVKTWGGPLTKIILLLGAVALLSGFARELFAAVM